MFISSVVGGFEEFRAAAADAIRTLGHEVERSEDLPASASSPQQACLAEGRKADVVVLLLGERYGAAQMSGISATHEEYREARERSPVLVFVQEGVTREPAQQAFVDEVEEWATGHVRVGFTDPTDLKTKLIRALHEFELAMSAGAVDEGEMVERATAMLPSPPGPGKGPQLVVAVAGGPYQQVLRPSEIEDPDLARDVQREALFGVHTVLDAGSGTVVRVDGSVLWLRQRQFMALDQAGSVSVSTPSGTLRLMRALRTHRWFIQLAYLAIASLGLVVVFGGRPW